MGTKHIRDMAGLLAHIERKTCFEALTGCLLWLGSRDKPGYAVIDLVICRPDHRVSRVMWKLHRGPIPHGLVVRHHCGNPACVNIDHLALGTNQENTNDAKVRNRLRVGERHGMSKLTPEQVRAIRADKRPLNEVAADYGIRFSNVSMIRLRRTWRHI